MKNVLLVVLDGWGHSDFDGSPDPGNAVELAEVPRFRALYHTHPRTRLACSGTDVGLPDGQMGNSEVGHLNLGAGRIVYQDIMRIDRAAADGTLAERLGLEGLVERLRARGGALHLVGLVSDGGVHSHLRHFGAVFSLLPRDLPVRVHCLTDGRDTPPTGGRGYVPEVEHMCAVSDAWRLASITGRYWAMDRDERWDRTRRAYELIAGGRSERWAEDSALLQASYDAGVTDEFVEPTGIRGGGEGGISPEDTVLMMNFRADRMRQLVSAICVPSFDAFERAAPIPAEVVTLTQYQEGLPVTVAFAPQRIDSCLGGVLADLGIAQLRVAETEKYAHVTYFFNGGEETPFEGEERALVPSPKVATYDLQPEMSAAGVAEAVVEGVRGGAHRFILVNFANPDMVGHTGSIPAARAAVEAVDGHLGMLIDLVHETPGWVALVTADHGNCEKMLNPDGSVHTAHTTEPVDFIVVDPDGSGGEIHGPGRLADVAPTVLNFLGIERPEAMTGHPLVPVAVSER